MGVAVWNRGACNVRLRRPPPRRFAPTLPTRGRVRQPHCPDDPRHPTTTLWVCAPVTIPYRRFSTNNAHWWIGRALRELTGQIGAAPARSRRAVGCELHGRPRHRDRIDPAFRHLAALARSHRARRRERHRGTAAGGACRAGRRRRIRRMRRRRYQPRRLVSQDTRKLFALRAGRGLSLWFGRRECLVSP